MFCPKCGTENRPNARFCKSCGHAFAGGGAGGSAPLTGPSSIEHTFVMRSVGPDDPGRTNVSLPSLEMQPESAPPPGPAPDNSHHGDGFILGDISSPNLRLDAPPPGATAGPESLPDLFATNISTPQFPPTLISPPPPPSASPPLSPPAGGFSVPDPLATKTGTPAASLPTPQTLVPAAGRQFSRVWSVDKPNRDTGRWDAGGDAANPAVEPDATRRRAAPTGCGGNPLPSGGTACRRTTADGTADHRDAGAAAQAPG